MPRTSTDSTKKKKSAPKLSPARKSKIKKAQDAGGLSNVAVSHTSKKAILKAVKEKQEGLN